MKLSYFDITRENIDEALSVVKNIFPSDEEHFTRHYNEYVSKDISYWKYVRCWKYFCVKDDNNRIVAVTGIYNESDKHPDDEIWLGWFGVSPEFRGKGIGREVLVWTMNLAKDLGYKKFKLWTTTDNDEKEAQKLYEKLNLMVYKKERYENTNLEKLYREIDL